MSWIDYGAQNWVQQEAKTDEMCTEVRHIEAEIKKYEMFQLIAGSAVPHDAIDKKLNDLSKLRLELMTLIRHQHSIAGKARKDEWG